MDLITFEEKGPLTIVHGRSDWNLGNIKDVEAVFSMLIDKKPETIAINCKDLVSVDSTAIATMVKILRKTRELSIRLVFYDLSLNIQNTFNLMTLNKFFTIMSLERFEQEFGSN
jgi:anti-anti-sigma factor